MILPRLYVFANVYISPHLLLENNWCDILGHMDILSIAQIAVSALVIALVLIQERASGVSGLFGGGGGEGGFYQTRRGLEKIIFIATVILMIIFAGLALLNLLI